MLLVLTGQSSYRQFLSSGLKVYNNSLCLTQCSERCYDVTMEQQSHKLPETPLSWCLCAHHVIVK